MKKLKQVSKPTLLLKTVLRFVAAGSIPGADDPTTITINTNTTHTNYPTRILVAHR